MNNIAVKILASPTVLFQVYTNKREMKKVGKTLSMKNDCYSYVNCELSVPPSRKAPCPAAVGALRVNWQV